MPENDQVIGWIREIVLDTADPHRLAGFWAALLGGTPVQWYPGWVTLEPPPHGQRLSFQGTGTAPATRPGVHFDVLVSDLDAAQQRVVALGGSYVEQHVSPRPGPGGEQISWRVCRDPDGHLFCLVTRLADLSALPGTSPLPCGAMRILAGFGRFSLAVAAGAALAATGAAPLTASASVVVPAARQLPDFGNPAGHAAIPAAGRAVNTSHPDTVIGGGTPAGCTSAAVVKAVARGGVITFNCGPNPVTIKMTTTAKLRNTSHRVVLDGGGLVTLNGGGKHQILYLDTCDPKQKITTSDCYNQEWPRLVVQNITLENGNSQVRQSPNVNYGGGGGGAIFDLGGQLEVVNSRFLNNRCYAHGPDLGGAAIRALAQWRNHPVYITKDTFTGGRCSNGGALSSIQVSWVVTNSVMTNNRAIGFGQNPAQPGTLGGGSGGAIYNDGDRYSLKITGTVIRNNHAREGGGAIFFVSNNNTGWVTIKNSTLHNNPSAVFWTRPYPGIYFHSKGHPRIVNSKLS